MFLIRRSIVGNTGFVNVPSIYHLVLGLVSIIVAWLLIEFDEQLSHGDETGKKIYASLCASCHGAVGEGNENHYSEPLRGDLSLNELTKLITETMPKENPGRCVAEQADLVGKYVFDNFYSAQAQRRLSKARVQLSRLTVRQYRESVADLLGTFNEPVWIPKERGISGNYFASRNWTENRRLAKQTDGTIDFGNGVPYFEPTGEYKSIKPAKDQKKDVNLMNQGFSVFWTGGLIVPESGRYEIVVESKNGFDLRINDLEHSLIDRRVRSDDVLEHSAFIYLLGGRPYGLKLNMFSYPKPPAKLRLLWRRPGGPLEVIPKSALISHTPAEVAVVSTAFPADDASHGYRRGVSVSRQWDSATTDAAVEVATWVSDRVWRFAKTKPTDEDATRRVRAFCYELVSRAFVKELTDEERQFFVDQHFDQKISLTDQVKRVVIMALKSPRFLYPAIENRNQNQELARRLSLNLWDSIPDKQLLDLADNGELTKPDVFSSELARMVQDPRSKQKLRSFFHYWLKTDHASEMSKDKLLFPQFDEQLVADLKTSLDLGLNDMIWSDQSDFRELFLADYLYVNDRIAEFYGIEAQGTGFHKVVLDSNARAGILTHPFLMSGFAYHKASSPIHRGVFVVRQLLGRRLGQPPENVEPLTEEFNPKMTTRERVEHQTRESGCMNCHSVINPLGFSLENYDAVGRFRTEEKRKPIDVSSVYRTPDGHQVELNGARDLGVFLASNKMTQRSFVQQLFNHYAKQPIDAYGPEQLDQLHQRFVQSEFNVRELLVAVARVTVNFEMEEKD